MPAPASWTRTARWLPAIGWALAIFAFSSMPASSIPGPWGDYSLLGHFVEYAILAALLVFAVGRPRLGTALALTLLLACSLYAVSDEFHQSFVPGRDPDPIDWAADTAGAGVAIAAIEAARRRRPRRDRLQP
jgi:VanZ family protein